MNGHVFMKQLVLCSLPESNIHEGIVYKIIKNYIYIHGEV